ncbi:MAG: flagellar biosynthesis protein FliQ [bacterium]|nr:flagellar biosynthesis protein FliQ [bacterium]
MGLDFVIKIVRESLLHTLIISSPVLIVSLVMGLIISIFQATTSIQEQTLTFVPKLVGIFLAIVLFGTFMIEDLINFTNQLFMMLPEMVR